MRVRDQRPAHAHRVVEPRMLERAVIRVVVVVEYVDSPDEGDRSVDDGHLPMHAAQSLAIERIAPQFRSVHLEQHARFAQRPRAKRIDVRRAEAVHDDVHAHATAGRTPERGADAPAGRVVLEDVRFEIDARACLVDRPLERREVLGARLEQFDLVAASHARLQALVPAQRDLVPGAG